MEHLYIPPDYKSELSLYDTQVAIKTVKDFFQKFLGMSVIAEPRFTNFCHASIFPMDVLSQFIVY